MAPADAMKGPNMKTWITAILFCVQPLIAAAQTSHVDLPPDTIVAIIDGVAVTLSEVNGVALNLDAKRLFSLNQQLYNVRERALTNLIGERLLAQAARNAGVTVEDYVAALPADPVSEREVELTVAGALKRNPAIDRDKLRELAREHLRDQKRQDARRRHIEELKLEHKKAGRPIVMNLQPPRVKVPISPGDPTKGNGAIELIEFSDFECPFCQKAQSMIRELLVKYDGKVKLVWKDFPLPNHQFAVPAALAARCAQDQGKFWEYHDVLFANQQALTNADLRRHAATVGLDLGAFDGCVGSGRHRDSLAAVLDGADTHLVEATPTFLVNGRVVQGAVPLYELAAVIDEELGN
jgi:protein-disulfide isomerase